MYKGSNIAVYILITKFSVLHKEISIPKEPMFVNKQAIIHHTLQNDYITIQYPGVRHTPRVLM
jgi:hypothetical protein